MVAMSPPLPESRFSVTLTHLDGYGFTAEFEPDGPRPIAVDEFPPLGNAAGPNPTRLLATAVAHCLSASLLHCFGKQRIPVGGFRTTVEGRLTRNPRGRLRIADLRVVLQPAVESGEWERLGRCVDLFEDFCIVTESVRQGIPVEVVVEPVPAEATALSSR